MLPMLLQYSSIDLLALRSSPLSWVRPAFNTSNLDDGPDHWASERWPGRVRGLHHKTNKRPLVKFLVKFFVGLGRGAGKEYGCSGKAGLPATITQARPTTIRDGEKRGPVADKTQWRTDEQPIPRMVGNGRRCTNRGPYRHRECHLRSVQAVRRSDPLYFPGGPGSEGVHPPMLRLVYLNARSVANKAHLVRDLVESEHADLACITETWLGPEGGVPLVDLCPPGFQVLHQPRTHGRGGGVAVIIRESLSPRETTVPQMVGCESLLLRYGPGAQLGLLLAYLPPNRAVAALPELLDVLSGLVVEFPKLMVLGDFNLPSLGGSSELAREFMASMAAMDLSQIISGLTHERGHTPDLVFLSGRWRDDIGGGATTVTPLSWTDHHLLRLDFPFATPRRGCTVPTRWYRPRRLMDPDRFQAALGDAHALPAHSSADALVEAWEKAATEALDRVVPLRPLTRRRSQRAPWFTAELREMKRRRRGLESRWRSSRSESDRLRLRILTRSYLAVIRVAKSNYFSTLIASADNRPAALFRVTHSLLNQEVREEPLQGRAEEFGQYLLDKIARIRTGLDSNWAELEEQDMDKIVLILGTDPGEKVFAMLFCAGNKRSYLMQI
ncbi:uncharacterized protein M6D78_000899 [Vipera latastei]